MATHVAEVLVRRRRLRACRRRRRAAATKYSSKWQEMAGRRALRSGCATLVCRTVNAPFDLIASEVVTP